MTNLNPYQVRDRLLKEMGFASYREYLKSELWKKIRLKVLKRQKNKCFHCDGFAFQVHHTSYSRATLKGVNLAGLVAVCRACHESAEFINGQKTTLQTANQGVGFQQRRVCKTCSIECEWSNFKSVKDPVCRLCRMHGKKKSIKIRTQMREHGRDAYLNGAHHQPMQ